MKTPNYKQFQPEKTALLLHRLETAGKYTVVSEISPSVGYLINNGMIGILAGKNGMLSVDIEKMPIFISELTGIYELAKYRREIGAKGA